MAGNATAAKNVTRGSERGKKKKEKLRKTRRSIRLNHAETISAGFRASTNNPTFQETGIVTGIYRNSVSNWGSATLLPMKARRREFVL